MSTIIKCVHGHYYDRDKSQECPYCKKKDDDSVKFSTGGSPAFGGSSSIGEDVTMAIMPNLGQDIHINGRKLSRQTGSFGMSGDDEHTVALIPKGIGRGNSAVTGWLVCTAGPAKGRDYRLSFNKNWIGRSYNSDVVLAEVGNIAENRQCCIVYDPRGNKFYLTPEDGTSTYLNGGLLCEPRELKLGDELGLGDCKFEFVPFCREGHVWDSTLE